MPDEEILNDDDFFEGASINDVLDIPEVPVAEPTPSIEAPVAQPQTDFFEGVSIDDVLLQEQQEQQNFQQAVDSYIGSEEFLGTSYDQSIDRIKEIYNSTEWDEKADEVFVNTANTLQEEFGKSPSFQDLISYFPPLPSAISDTSIPEEERLKLIDDWEETAEGYGALRAREEGVYADYLSKRDAVLETKRQLARAGRREVKGQDVGVVSDKVKRFIEGGLTFIPRAVGLSSVTEFLEDTINENPEFDDSTTSQVAFNLGQGVAQIGTAAITKNPTTATAVLLAGNASLIFQDAYSQALEITGDPDQALEAGFLAAPGAFIDTIGDVFIAGKLFKGISKASKFRELGKIGKIKQIKKAVGETTKDIFEAGLTEAIVEPLQGSIQRAAVRAATGEESIDILDPSAIGQEALVAGLTGGVLGGAAGAGGRFIQNRAVDDIFNQLAKEQGLDPTTIKKDSGVVEKLIRQKEAIRTALDKRTVLEQDLGVEPLDTLSEEAVTEEDTDPSAKLKNQVQKAIEFKNQLAETLQEQEQLLNREGLEQDSIDDITTTISAIQTTLSKVDTRIKGFDNEIVNAVTEELTPQQEPTISEEERTSLTQEQETLLQTQEELQAIETPTEEQQTQLTEVDNRLEEIQTTLTPEVSPPTEPTFGISAASIKEFGQSKSFDTLVEKGKLSPEVEAELRLAGGIEKMNVPQFKLDTRSDTVFNKYPLPQIINNLNGSEKNIPEITEAEPWQLGNLIAHTINRAENEVAEAVASNDPALSKKVFTAAEMYQSLSGTGTVAGRTLNVIQDAYNRILPTRKRIDAIVQEALNTGKAPSSEELKGVELKVSLEELEKTAIKNEIEQKTILSDANQKVIDGKEPQIKESEEQIDTLSEELKEREQEVQALKNTLKGKKRPTDEDFRKIEDKIVQLNKQIADIPARDPAQVVLENKEEALSDRLAKKRREALTLKAQLKRAETTLTKGAVENLRKKLVSTEEEVISLRDELDFTKAQIENNKELSALRDLRKQLGRERSKLKQAIKKLPTEEQLIASQREQAVFLEGEIARLKKELESNRARIEALKEVIRKRNEPLRQQLKDIKRLTNNLKQKENNILTERERLQKLRSKENASVDFKTVPPEVKAKLDPLLQQYEKVVDSGLDSELIKRNLLTDILTIVAAESNISATDLLGSIWYINILSGLTAQEANTVSGGLNASLQTFSAAVADPTSAFTIWKGMVRGARRGSNDFMQSLRGKETRVSTLDKLNVPRSALSLLRTPDSQLSPEALKRKRVVQALTLGVGDYMLRALSAVDVFIYRTAEGARTNLIAQRVLAGKTTLQTNEETLSEVANILHNADENFNLALEEATKNLEDFGFDTTTTEGQRFAIQRAYEIIDNSRPQALVDEARLFGAQATFTQEPTGNVGVIARLVKQGIKNGPKIGNFEVTRVFVPFVDIVGNVTDAAMDYSPIGFIRAASNTVKTADGKLVQLESILDDPNASGINILGKEYLTLFKQREKAAKAMIGSGFAGILWGIADAYSDDDEPLFAVYGSLTKDPNRNRTLKESGIEPFSIRIGGASFIYRDTPLFPVLAFVGSYFDSKRWNKNFDQKTSIDVMSAGMGASVKALSDSGFLTGMSEMFDIISGDEKAGDMPRLLAKRAKSFSTGFIPAKGFMQSLTNLGEQTEIDKYEGFLWPYMIASVPGANKLGTRPQLNVFGEPVQDQDLFFGSRYYQAVTKDEDFKYLAKNDLTLPHFPPAHRMSFGIGKKGTNRQQRLLDRIKKARKQEFDTIGDFKKYAARLAYDKYTEDERYEIVKIAGPKIRTAVSFVRSVGDTLNKKQKQELLDKLVKDAKIDAKADFLRIPNRSKRPSQRLREVR